MRRRLVGASAFVAGRVSRSRVSHEPEQASNRQDKPRDGVPHSLPPSPGEHDERPLRRLRDDDLSGLTGFRLAGALPPGRTRGGLGAARGGSLAGAVLGVSWHGPRKLPPPKLCSISMPVALSVAFMVSSRLSFAISLCRSPVIAPPLCISCRGQLWRNFMGYGEGLPGSVPVFTLYEAERPSSFASASSLRRLRAALHRLRRYLSASSPGGNSSR